ncbi:putative phage abortive infection protein [Vreelandella titanicae]|uniref:putative phage abortive infection protein n=1 Tax=Vreelandella titanicae TaxID=664683 RepID=UPI003822B8A0
MNLNKKLYLFFLDIIGSEDEKTSKALYRLFQIALLAVTVVFTVNLFFNGKSSFGEWGDFFGGVLNPILTFLTFMGLLITIVIQQSELKESRKEFKRSADALNEQSRSMKKQNFENTLFQMLALHNDIVNSIDLTDKETGITTTGRDCFRVFYTRLARIYRKKENNANGSTTPEILISNAYKAFWRVHQTELAHYFRYLFNVIKFIDESNFSDGPYIKLIRAQLSDSELFILFYNSQTEQGKKFVEYIEKYSLFDNMPTLKLLNKSHKGLIGSKAYESNL